MEYTNRIKALKRIVALIRNQISDMESKAELGFVPDLIAEIKYMRHEERILVDKIVRYQSKIS